MKPRDPGKGVFVCTVGGISAARSLRRPLPVWFRPGFSRASVLFDEGVEKLARHPLG